MAQTQDDAVNAEENPDTTNIVEDGKEDGKTDLERGEEIPPGS
ncbi:MAG: hypothetical protein V3T72_06075 [Thermoanaerobaculia bacterium]